MKTRICKLLCMMCAGLIFAGIPAAAEEEQSTEAVIGEAADGDASAESESEEENFMQELITPNTLEELAAKYGRVSFTVTWYAADGTESFWTVYRDDTRYVDESDDVIWIDEGGDVYGMNYETGDAYRYLFVGDDMYEAFRENTEAHSNFSYGESEEIVSWEVSDGLIYLETIVYYSDEYTEDDLIDHGYEEGRFEYELAEYVIDEETYEILECTTYAVSEDEKVLFTYDVLNTEPEEFVVDEAITEAVFGEDVRSLSVVTDAGTDEEAVYTQTVTKGSWLVIQRGAEFEDVYYADPECTEIVEDTTQYDTIYLKRIVEE